MGEIKEKEYIRTDKGSIWKVVVKTSTGVIVEYGKHIHYDTIKSHSLNIIDLIEVGDYVNGYEIVNITNDLISERKKLLTEHWEKEDFGDMRLLQFYGEDIKSVVTQEQFEDIKYEVKVMEENIINEIDKIQKYCRSRQCEECQYLVGKSDCALRNPSMWVV